VSINIALLRSEKQSPCIVTADIFMTNAVELSDKTFAANLHRSRSSVTRAVTMRPKLASVGKNESQGE
jgi:formaldehyde-activating enzyme involved in methanogenesis